MSETIAEQAESHDEQPNEDRVNNRTLSPRGATFKEFMAAGWQELRGARRTRVRAARLCVRGT